MLRLSSGSQRLSGSKFQAPMTKTIQLELVVRYDHLPLSGRLQMFQPVTSAVSMQLSINYGKTVPWKN